MVLTVCGHWLPRPPGSSGPGNTAGTAGRQVARVRASRAARSPPPSPGLSGLSRQQAHTSAPSSLRRRSSTAQPAAPVRHPGRFCSGSPTWRRGRIRTLSSPQPPGGRVLPLGPLSCLLRPGGRGRQPQGSLASRPSHRQLPVTGMFAPGPKSHAHPACGLTIWVRVPCWPAWPLHTPTPRGSHH